MVYSQEFLTNPLSPLRHEDRDRHDDRTRQSTPPLQNEELIPRRVIAIIHGSPTLGGESMEGRKAYARKVYNAKHAFKRPRKGDVVSFSDEDLKGVQVPMMIRWLYPPI